MRLTRPAASAGFALAAVALLTACTPAQTGHTAARTSASPAPISPPSQEAAPSTAAPAPVTVPTPTTSPAPVVGAPPASLVTAWARQNFHGLSFIVPADHATIDVENGTYPRSYATYRWNGPMQAGVPPITVGVYVATVFPPGVHGGQDPTSQMRAIDVRGCTSAHRMENPVQGQQGETRTDVFCTTATTFYSLMTITPSTAAGNAVAQTMVNSLKADTGQSQS